MAMNWPFDPQQMLQGAAHAAFPIPSLYNQGLGFAQQGLSSLFGGGPPKPPMQLPPAGGAQPGAVTPGAGAAGAPFGGVPGGPTTPRPGGYATPGPMNPDPRVNAGVPGNINERTGNLPQDNAMFDWGAGVDRALKAKGLNPYSSDLMIKLIRQRAGDIGNTLAGRAAVGGNNAWFDDAAAQQSSILEAIDQMSKGAFFPTAGAGRGLLGALRGVEAVGNQGGDMENPAIRGAALLAQLMGQPERAANMFASLLYGGLSPESRRVAVAPLQGFPDTVEDILRGGVEPGALSHLDVLLQGGGYGRR